MDEREPGYDLSSEWLTPEGRTADQEDAEWVARHGDDDAAGS